VASATALPAAAETTGPSTGPFGGPFGGAIGGPFRLIDHHGEVRTEADPAGRAQLLFFGYANCEGICSHALPMMAALTDRVAEAGQPVTPLLITIDPGLDTVEALATAVPGIHPDLVGLTGSPAALAAAREGFQVHVEKLFEDPAGHPVYAHGSYIYLLDPQGAVLTLMPPILGLDRMEEVVLSYLEPDQSPGG
jgi:protein SCO1/2